MNVIEIEKNTIMKKNKIIIILSHCNTEEKKNVLVDNIQNIKNKTNCDILLTSHIPLPESIIELCDYFTYDKSNPILTWPYRTFVHWKDINNGENFTRLSYCVNDYGWTPFNQIIKGFSTIERSNYEMVYIVNYDILLNDDILNEINNDVYQTTSYKVVDQYGSESYPSLIFGKFIKNDIKKLCDNLEMDVYLKKSHAEKYLEDLLSNINVHKSDIVSYDQIDFSNNTNGKKFNHSVIDEFSLFVSNFNFTTQKKDNKFFFYGVKKDINIIINGKNILLKEGKTLLIENTTDIKITHNGVIIDLPFVCEDEITEIKNVNYD